MYGSSTAVIMFGHNGLSAVNALGTAIAWPDKVVTDPMVYGVCVFSFHSFWKSMDVPVGVTQEEGPTGFLIHLLSAVRMP